MRDSSGSNGEEIIEQIDVSGVASVRAAPKNFYFTPVISIIQDYEALKAKMIKNNNETTLKYRKYLATKAFALTAYDDSYIYSWFLSQSNNNELPVLCAIWA